MFHAKGHYICFQKTYNAITMILGFHASGLLLVNTTRDTYGFRYEP